ncbi:MAG: lamin tail domain-containing protein [Candidatus Paceibacterota bacterium]
MLFSKKIFVFAFLFLTILSVSFFIFQNAIFAETDTGVGNGILISEIKLAGTTSDGETVSNDEFIELYNSNVYTVDLKGWALKKKTKTGSQDYNILSDIDGQIPASGYFLIVPRDKCGDDATQKCYLGETLADKNYSTDNYLAEDNSVTLYDNLKNQVDKVGWGAATDFLGNVFGDNFSAGQSLEREVVAGKMQNTKNNAADFFVQVSPNPQNSSFTREEEIDDSVTLENSVEADNLDADTDESGSEDSSGEDLSEDVIDTDVNTNTSANTNQDEDRDDENENENNNSSLGVQEEIVTEEKVVITELLINSAGDDGVMEFVEIYNTGKDAVDLSSWSLEDQAGKTGKYVFPEGTQIGSGKYRVFYSSTTKLALNNSGDGAVIKDEAGMVVYKTPFSDEAEKEVSFALADDGKWYWTVLPTPTAENVIKSVEVQETGTEEEEGAVDVEVEDEEDVSEMEYDFSEEVIINEILPNPVGDDNREENYEWIEFFNGGGRDVNLRGWCLDDVFGKGSKAYCFGEDKIIVAGGYVVVSSSESKIFFNNAVEDANLLWVDKTVIDKVSYEKAKEDYSYSRGSDGDWFWTKIKTPSEKNVLPDIQIDVKEDSLLLDEDEYVETEIENGGEFGQVASASSFDKSVYEFVSIEDARGLSARAQVGFDGVVSVPPRIFGGNVFYITAKDSGEGIQIFSYGDSLPAMELGDEIEVFGNMSEVGGEKRLVLSADSSAYKISVDNLLQFSSVDFESLENSLGDLVKVEGIAADVADRIFYLDTENGRIKIYAKPDTGISFENINSGDRLEVTGIFSRTSEAYRILPRFESDIRFLEKEFDDIIEKDSFGQFVKGYSNFFSLRLLFFFGFVIFLDWIRVRLKNGRNRLGK